MFKRIFNLEPGFALDGSQFGRLFADGETFRIGALEATAIHVPGHTPADMATWATPPSSAAVHAGRGHGALRLPGGDARQLYRSIRRPAAARRAPVPRLSAGGREARWQTTVAEQRQANIHVRDGISETNCRHARRDATLGMPTLILPAIQVNIRAGHFPPAEDNGVRYLKIPVDSL